MVEFLFKFPTKSRPVKFKNTLEKYYSFLSNKYSYKFVITMNNNDGTMDNRSMINYLESKPNLDFYYERIMSKVQAINANIDKYNDFNIICLLSDDMIPVVPGFDEIIFENMLKYSKDFDIALHFNDGRVGQKLNTLSIMGKKLYDYFGYIYHPDYTSLWCDNEFHDVTYAMNKAVYIDQVIIKHEWIKYTGRDMLNVENEKFYKISNWIGIHDDFQKN